MNRKPHIALCATLVLPLTATVNAQPTYPTKSVRVIVPFAPGGGADTLARILFSKLSEDLGHQFIIDNRGGGSGTIGAAMLAKATPDGYAILHDATGHSINPAMFPKLPYSYSKDFLPVFLAGVVPNLLVTHNSITATTVPEIIELAKASREGLNWGSSGNGSVQHMALELFRINAGIRLNHIPYKSGAPALADVMGGHLKFYFSNAAASTNLVKGGTIRAVAHTGRGRLAALPTLPPVADTLAGFEAYEWNGVFVPAGTPRAVIDRLNAALNAVIRAPAIIERLASLSVQSRANTPAEFGAFVATETAKWGKVVRDANIRVE